MSPSSCGRTAPCASPRTSPTCPMSLHRVVLGIEACSALPRNPPRVQHPPGRCPMPDLAAMRVLLTRTSLSCALALALLSQALYLGLLPFSPLPFPWPGRGEARGSSVCNSACACPPHPESTNPCQGPRPRARTHPCSRRPGRGGASWRPTAPEHCPKLPSTPVLLSTCCRCHACKHPISTRSEILSPKSRSSVTISFLLRPIFIGRSCSF